MVKQKTLWACSECGHHESKWAGCCPQCGGWNTFEEEVPVVEELGRFPQMTTVAKPLRIQDIHPTMAPRQKSCFVELDRLLGGGFIKGSLSLVGGEPGIGKSTLMLQLANKLALQGLVVLYVCGEESSEQTSLRAQRLGISSSNIYLFSETLFSNIRKYVNSIKPDILIIDSVQIVYKGDIPSTPGSVSQVREVSMEAMQIAKGLGITTLLIGHVTKSGEIAGPRVLEHIVDTVLEFEGDRSHGYRMLRSLKNRFGPTDDVALFQMRERGLEEVLNPSEAFLQERIRGASGSAVISTIEGSRALLIEVQALVTTSSFSNASRRSTGVDGKRMALLLAVLEKRMGYQLHSSDVFVSVVGGISVSEPGTDLGIAAAIGSSFLNKAIASDVVVIGEVGLAGEVRSIPRIEPRVKEAINMGFRKCVIAKKNIPGLNQSIHDKIELYGVERVEEAMEFLFE